jgi:hypothetical protein
MIGRPSPTVAMTRRSFATTSVLLGHEQARANMPNGTDRKKGRHGYEWMKRSRYMQPREQRRWKAMSKLQLEMGEEWDDLEQFRLLPKPKKVLGNEACHVIWPYPTLLEREVKLHHFTKSIYVYYPQHALTQQGEFYRQVAREFSYEHLIPITFHNNQCYVETEMLVEYNDTPWLVINCLDGRHEIVPVAESTVTGVDDKAPRSVRVEQGHRALLERVLQTAEKLGSSVEDPNRLMVELHNRPLQNQYVRIDYMWTGRTREERAQHLVQWTDDDAAQQPTMRNRQGRLLSWLNVDSDEYALHQQQLGLVHKERKRLATPNKGGSMDISTFHLSQRNSGNWGGVAGAGPKRV